MPITIVYVGPLADGVELQDGQIAAPGRPVEVETELAESYLEQEVFVRPNTNDAKDAARPAKSPRKTGTQGDEG